MIKSIFNKILKKFKKKIIVIHFFILEKKIYRYVLSNRINSVAFFKLALKYLMIFDKHQYVAIGYLKKKIKVDQSKKNLNLIEYLLPSQKMSLPSFFGNNLSFLNINRYLGIEDHDNQEIYEKTINHLSKNTNDLDCDYFLSLISKNQPFHYLKYTHGLWDNLLKCSIKEYAIKNSKNLTLSHGAINEYNIFINNNFAENLFKLINSKKFTNMVKSKDIYFCPTTSNGALSFKIELKILSELSKKNILYNYSQIMCIDEFSADKPITSSNIFKKIICTDSLRNIFLNKIKKYDLILICNHSAASKLSSIYPNFKKIYALPDLFQNTKHLSYPMEFANDVCEKVLTRGTTKPTLILSQAGLLSTFISFTVLDKYKEENISLIDIGKPLQTLFSPEITAGGPWRDANKIKTDFHNLQHLISESLFQELKEDTKIETGKNYKYVRDMDIEENPIHRNTLF